MTVATHAQPQVRQTEKSSVLSWFVLWVTAPLAVGVLLFSLWTSAYQGKIYPGVVIGDVSVGGLTPAEATRLLAATYPRTSLPPLEVMVGEERWLLPVYVTYDFTDAVYTAYALGREGSLWERVQTQVELLVRGYRLSPTFQVDKGAVRTRLNTLAAGLYRPVEEPTVAVDEHRVSYQPGRPGREVDIAATWQALQQRLDMLSTAPDALPDPVPLSVRYVGPTPMDVSALQDTARRLGTRPFRIEAGDRTFALDPATISRAISLQPVRQDDGRVEAKIVVNRKVVRQILADLNATYATKPVDARLDYDPENDRFIVLSPSQEGWELDVEAAVDIVVEALAAGKSRAQVPARVLSPAVPDDATPAMLGIREVVGEGTTGFLGSSAARVKNIVRAAEAVRGVVIPPGAVFSFNEAANAITAANGYEDSLIIWGDRTAVGIGGGVCQVSTTLYRAAFYAGLPIVERWNHGYIVSWYGEPGFDATVYSPYVDLKFKNTTNAYLLVQPVVDTKRGILTFRLWGTKPNWTVELSEPVREDVQDPPPPVYREDPTLPKGTIRQVEWAKPGMTVRVTRTVRQGDRIIEQREFVSHYEPWRAVYLYGPGTEVPKSP